MKCPLLNTNSKYIECSIDNQTCFGFEKDYFDIEYCHKYQKARAEKAEAELEAIKAVITRYENGSCLQKCIRPCSDCLAREIIKQIGGAK